MARSVFSSAVARVIRTLAGPRHPESPIRSDLAPDPAVAAEFVHDNLRPEGRLRTLGTFGGVFTPSFLTIIGVIMYLRFSWVLANAGLFQTLLIVVIANTITAITALSVAGIGSNERMETGGAYFMVSRVLGYQAGGGIGIPLYVSQALSIALYVMGFAEALIAIFPAWPIRLISIVTMVILALFGLIGARFMVKIQYVILAAILMSFVSIAAGFRIETANLTPAYAEGLSFWAVFAVFFPAVTGILAGVSMSGDLRDPAKNIPRGTMLAVAAGLIVYLLVPVMLAFSVPRDELVASTALRDASRWPVLVTIGVIGATLSSAIGSLLAAPRTLQALSIDGITPQPLAKGVGQTSEPVLAMALSMALATGAILIGNLNAIAEVLTMFFLTTYGVLNLSAGMEYVVANPSFRPAIRTPAWVSFLGATACLAVMFLISPASTIIAVAVVILIFVGVGARGRKTIAAGNRLSGVWEGFWTGRLFAVSRRLASARSSSGKNWRPIVQVFAADISVHSDLMTTAALLTDHGGALATYAMLSRTVGTTPQRRAELQDDLHRFVTSLREVNVFTNIIECAGFHEGVLIASQAAEFAGGSYNTVILGMPRNSRGDADFARMLLHLSRYGRNVLLFKKGDRSWTGVRGPIVVWWGGQENNVRLMLILAHLLQRSAPNATGIRLATIVREAEQMPGAQNRLEETIAELRLSAKLKVVVNDRGLPIPAVLSAESADASLVILGMAEADESDLGGYLPRLRHATSNLGSTLLVQNNIPDVVYV